MSALQPPQILGTIVAGGALGGSVLYVDNSASLDLAQDHANFFWDGTSHRLGIGTTSPGAPITIGTAFSNTTGNVSGLRVGTTQTAASTGSNFGIFVNNAFTATGTQAGLFGMFIGTSNNSTGTVTVFEGLEMSINNAGNGNVSFMYAFAGVVENSGTGTITQATGLYAQIQNNGAGTISTAYGIYVVAPANGGGGTITTKYGMIIEPSAGNVGIGTTSPTSLLSVGSSNNFQVNSSGLIPEYNGVATAGWGVPAIYGHGRVTAQTAAAASIATYTVGAADGSFIVSANVLVTAVVTANFTMTCTYTDEGNTSRTLTMTFSNIGGTLLTAITNVTGTGAYEGVPLHIRCKASTSITFATTGTFTSVTYNAEGTIEQIA